MPRKPISGVGINDADYNVVITKYPFGRLGKRIVIWECHFYLTWKGMIDRCYGRSQLRNRPSYEDCFVCDEWLIFSNFKKWMERQDCDGMHLDKDILVKGNKVYSPDTCLFVPPSVNTFLSDCGSAKSGRMTGVIRTKYQKFRVKLRNQVTDKMEHVGCYDSAEDAIAAYRRRKKEIAFEIADLQKCDRVAAAIRNYFNE